jgi:hypothetical protein
VPSSCKIARNIDDLGAHPMLIVRHCGPKRFWGPSATIWSQSTADHCVRLLAGADGDEGCLAAWCGLVGWVPYLALGTANGSRRRPYPAHAKICGAVLGSSRPRNNAPVTAPLSACRKGCHSDL